MATPVIGIGVPPDWSLNTFPVIIPLPDSGALCFNEMLFSVEFSELTIIAVASFHK